MSYGSDDELVAPVDGDRAQLIRRGFLDEFNTIRVDFLKSYGLLREEPAELEWRWLIPTSTRALSKQILYCHFGVRRQTLGH